MRPGTAPSGRKRLPGFNNRHPETRPPSAASKTRPLKRSQSSKAAPLLVKGDFSVLLPPDLTMQKLNAQARCYLKNNVIPIKKVNTFQLFQALKETIMDTKDVMNLVKCGSNLNTKIMRRNSLHLLPHQRFPRNRQRGPALQFYASDAQIQRKFRPSQPPGGVKDLVSLMREFARLQASAEFHRHSDTIVVAPKPPAHPSVPPPKPREEESPQPPFALRVSIDSLSRTDHSRDIADSSSSPSYTFVSQYVDQLAPKELSAQLKQKLRGRLVRLAA